MTILSDIIRRPYRTGQEEEEDPIERCTSGIQDSDLKSGAARKEAFRRAAECVADGYCATYGVPPGVCSSVAGPIAQEIANAADAVGEAFANGFEIQSGVGPTIAEREAWGAKAFNRAMNATRDIHNSIFPDDLWTLRQGKDYWLAHTQDVAALRYFEIYTRPGYYGPMPNAEEAAKKSGAEGMTQSFFVYNYSSNPGAVVQADVRAGLNTVTQSLVADRAKIEAQKRVVHIDPKFIANFPSAKLTGPQKVRRVAVYGGSLLLLWKLIGLIRR